jgi:hypothetical protein
MGRLGEPGAKADPAGAVGVRERASGKRRGWEVAVFACVAVTTSIAIGRAIENDPAPRPSAATPAKAAVEPLAAEAETPSSRDVADFDHPTVEPSPAAARVTTAAIRDPVTIEICGYGPVALPPDDPDPVQQLPRGLRSNALDAMRAEMTVSGDPQAHAAALLISLRSNLGGAQEQADLLARQATASQDPAIYAMALEGCRGFVAEGAGSCALLNRAQWARLDPDNVAPWLELAAEAHERGEAENEADAMGHAALARRSDGYEELLPGLVERTLLGSAPSLRLALALTTARTAQTVWSASRSNHAYEYCASGLAADAVRHRCEAIAEILTQRSVGPAERRTGVAIGRQLGWSQERLNAGQEPGSASVERVNLPTLGLDLSCDDVSRVERWLMAATPETTAAPLR